MTNTELDEIEEFMRLREKLLERKRELIDEIHRIDEALGKRHVTVPRSNRRADSRQGRVEAFMQEHPNLTANEIGAALDLTPNKVSNVLTGLFKSGRVTRVADRATARSVWRWCVSENATAKTRP